MPMPKDVRPSRPENVKRTSSVDMMLRASMAGGEHNTTERLNVKYVKS
jgi:hypothetical protein